MQDIAGALQHAAHLHQSGKTAKARESYKKILKADPYNFDALQLLGAVELQDKQFAEAAELIERALKINPRLPVIHTNLGTASNALGDMQKAEACYRHAIEIEPNFAQAHYNLAGLLKKQGHYEKAVTSYMAAYQLRPDHIETVLGLAGLLYELGFTAPAGEYLRRLIAAHPEQLQANNRLGCVLRREHRYQEAVACFEKALQLKPDAVDIRANLAEVFESMGNIDQARQAACSILKDNPDNFLAHLVMAKLDRRDGDNAAIKARLLPYLREQALPESDLLAAAYTELGYALDRLHEVDEAYAAFERANRIMSHLPFALPIDPQPQLGRIEKCRQWFTSERVAAWSTTARDGKAPIFLVGFPRSGTTLTEQIIASHPVFTSGDELPILHDMVERLGELVGRDISYPEGLDTLTAEEVAHLRHYYWSQVAQFAAPEAEQGRFVDKMPMNLIRLGLVRRIFPEAKIIVLLRDPRDVCLSCFMQLFHLNESTIHFLDIQNTVSFYCKVMSLWLQFRETLGLDWMEIYYEDVVTDLEDAARRLLEFLGEPWDEQVVRYFETAAKRSISTPSYQDVATPIYTRATGRWLRYQTHLEPFSASLQPYLQAFAYQG